MTMRERTASSISTYVRPDQGRLQELQDRQRQASGAFKQLGVHLKNRREEKLQDLSEATKAQTENEAVEAQALVGPKISELMQHEDTYKGDANDFMQSKAYQLGLDQITKSISAPDHRAEIAAQYKKGMLDQYAKGKEAQRLKKADRTQSNAQQAASEAGNIEMQMRVYDNAIATGTGRDKAFTSGLAAAILAGPKYLDKFAKARDWTPEEGLQIKKQQAALKKTNNSKANIAYKYAVRMQDRNKKYAELNRIQQTYGASLSSSIQENLAVELRVLSEELQAENWVKGQLGHMTIRDIADGRGYEGVKLPMGDIKRIQNEAFHAAVANKDIVGMTQLLALPNDEPEVAREFFGNVVGSITNLNKDDPKSVGKLKQTVEQAKFVEDALGPARMRLLLDEDSYADYQVFKGLAGRDGIEEAAQKLTTVKELEANGKLVAPAGWNAVQRRVVDKALDLGDWKVFSPSTWGTGTDHMTRASLEAQLAPHFKIWKAMHYTEEQMNVKVKALIEETAWNGYLSGGVMESHLNTLTHGNLGNPYGDKTAVNLWDEYKDAKLDEIRKYNENVSGLSITFLKNGEELLIQDTGGIPIPNGLYKVEDVIEDIKRNVPTVKQEVENE